MDGLYISTKIWILCGALVPMTVGCTAAKFRAAGGDDAARARAKHQNTEPLVIPANPDEGENGPNDDDHEPASDRGETPGGSDYTPPASTDGGPGEGGASDPGTDTSNNPPIASVPTPQPSPATTLTQTDTFVLERQGAPKKVDLVFIVDTSGSMVQEKASLEAGLATFINRFLTANPDVDYRLFLIGSTVFQFPLSVVLNPQVAVIRHDVGSYDSLHVARSFLKGELVAADNPIKFRADALKELIFATDDDTAQDPVMKALKPSLWVSLGRLRMAQEFTDFLNANPAVGSVRVNGLVGVDLSLNGQPDCHIMNPALEIIGLAASLPQRGFIQHLCAAPWDRLMELLGIHIVELPTTFVLARSPADPSAMVVNLNGHGLASSDFAYDPVSRRITLTNLSVIHYGDILTITY